MKKQYLEIGEIVTTHGVTGECKVYPWCDSTEIFSVLKTVYFDAEGRQAVAVQGSRAQGDMVLLKLEGCATLEQARRFVGKVLYADRGALPLPEGRCFIQDLLGCRVQDADTGEVYGTVHAITHPANCDIYEIKTPKGQTVLFPAVKEFVDTIDPDAEVITVRPIEGMFTECESI